MFDIFFGWRKASKCKKLVKRVQCRLKLLKNKRFTIVKQLREDLAQLIKLGYEETAFNRAEQLLKDENLMAVYDMLDQFCEFINIQLSYIRRNKDCPNDINEAVSSLIFASARCAELPELTAIRKLFGERYGHRFATSAVELLPGNLVNREIQEKLSVKSVSDDSKFLLMDEITRDYCLQPEILALGYFPDLQRLGSDGSEMEAKSVQVDPLQFQSTADCPNDRQGRNIDRRATSSSESVPRFSEEIVFYLDDIEELQPSMRKEAVDCQDQRLFKFKTLSLPRRAMVVDGTDGDGETDNEKPKLPNKSRRRSFCIERSSMKDKPKQPCCIAQNSGQFPVCVAEEILDDKFYHCQNPKRRSYDNGPSVHEVLALPRMQKATAGGSELRKGTAGPYLRAVTMPQERPREIHRYNVARSNSLSVHNANHVHPKLPEYEDIAAKFIALKERLLHKQ
ncbi:LOB domain-containing protein 41-like [Hibiscus syriacus]|uniref:LOB domain-containing protein 41-like n=1 Tax=Hibiscus syriacus TaxID=106335 RepID=A0A6A2WTI3_HIBSY|nr:LOB domain-containing protein 41-like [Hibiscus syriacus]